MPTYSGVWSLSQQFQGRGQGLWPAPPGAPTIGTASVTGIGTVSVTFTAPTCTGIPAGITGYQVKSTPGCFTATGSSSPITISGLCSSTAYTFAVAAQNASGYGAYSAQSNSVTPSDVVGQQAYTTPGTYSWVAPAGVTKVSVVAVGGGSYKSAAGLGWKNNISVTPGTSYTVRVGNRSPSCYVSGQSSYFISEATVKGGGGNWNSTVGGNYTGDGGGNGGGSGGTLSGAGAGGYTGNGANGNNAYNANGFAGSGGGGGSGALRNAGDYYFYGGGGGGVGILGQGSNGTAGIYNSGTGVAGGGGGGSGGLDGGNGTQSYSPGNGGLYGGGGGGGYDGPSDTEYFQFGGSGAVRIIWPGNTRSFPSTNTGNL